MKTNQIVIVCLTVIALSLIYVSSDGIKHGMVNRLSPRRDGIHISFHDHDLFRNCDFDFDSPTSTNLESAVSELIKGIK